MKREEKRRRDEAMKAYKAEGHTMQEVADEFGISKELAKSVCAGIAPQKPRSYRNQYACDSPEKIEQRAAEKVALYAPAFEYAGNYTGSEGRIDLRCKTCGTVQNRACITLRQRNVRCEACYRAELDKARAKKKAAKEKPFCIQVKEHSQMAMKTCKECGGFFIGRGVYCSDKCRRRVENRSHDRRLNGKVKDWTITLQQVYRKDKGICYLCGGMCDWSDIEDRQGVKIAGDMYPSIDHVVPLAHEGKHEWKNVRLAHRKCNYLKSDNPLPGCAVAN